MKIKQNVQNRINAIVIYENGRRAIHQYVNGGSRVEICDIVDGRPYGTPKVYIVEHSTTATPNDVFRFLGYPEFVRV